jgi:hypothetical protein
VPRKGFARKLEWVCYGTVRWVDVRLTNTGLAKYQSVKLPVNNSHFRIAPHSESTIFRMAPNPENRPVGERFWFTIRVIFASRCGHEDWFFPA